jgi:CheY-like chemotaxis protein
MTKVLLVEDDNNLREIFEMRLQAEGYNTVTAGDGEEALSVAMKEKPDLIIADVMMPKLSGFEMLENLRAAPEMASTKVVMMTALGQAEDRARGEKLGVIKYLVKSQVTLEDFIRVVREVIQPGGANVPPPGASPTTNQESEASMPPQDNAPPTNPMPPADPSGGGMPSADPSAPAASGQMSAADEQKDVQSQIDSFVASAPAEPAAGDSAAPAADPAASVDPAAAPAPDAGSSADAPAMPTTSAPGPDSSAPSVEPSQTPPAPAA